MTPVLQVDFLLAVHTTALPQGEVITAVNFLISEKAGLQHFQQPAGRFCIGRVFLATGLETKLAVDWTAAGWMRHGSGR